jgi:ribokinase
MQNPSKKHILVIGSINMDLVVTAPRHPEIGETILGSDFHTFPGGKGANQAVAAARLGGSVKMIGRLGADLFGAQLYQSITSDGVDTSLIQTDHEAPTGVALITVSPGGDNTIIVISGANARLTAEDIQAAEQAFLDASIVLMQLELPLQAIESAVRLAKIHGVKVVLNPAPALDLPGELLESVDYLIPNQTELSLLTGLDSTDASIGMLLGLGVKNLVVTIGEDGAILATAQHQTHMPAFRVAAVDGTAAGDAFVGAFAVALSEGRDIQQAVLWGNAAGALSATRPGAQPSLPTRGELEDFIHIQATI